MRRHKASGLLRAGAMLAILALACPTRTLAALSASVADVTLPAAIVAHESQVGSGSMTLTATDTGVLALGLVNSGWNVTIQSSSFAYSGPNSGTAIPADHLAITEVHPPTHVSGQAINPMGGPRTTGLTGSLDTPRKTMHADGPAGVLIMTYHGIGTYEQIIDVSLEIPAGARAGTYTATLTVTIAAGP